jgi:acyl-coenzyme A thioesterase PaaI-like protein
MVRKVSARTLRFAMNLWPPFFGAGIRVQHIAPDFRSATVDMRLRWTNRNHVGTHFGGSLYAMVDPFLMLMLLHQLGGEYRVWDKSGSIEYLAPGRGRGWARMDIGDKELEQIRLMTEEGDKHLHLFSIDIKDDEGMVVARVEKLIYIRRKRGTCEHGDAG